MSISLRVESPDNPLLENLLRYLDGLSLSLFQKRELLKLASEWLKLADQSGYPLPMAKSIIFQVGDESVLESQRNANT